MQIWAGGRRAGLVNYWRGKIKWSESSAQLTGGIPTAITVIIRSAHVPPEISSVAYASALPPLLQYIAPSQVLPPSGLIDLSIL